MVDYNWNFFQIPAFGVFDANITYDFNIGDFASSLYANVYNITDEEFVMNAQDGSNHDAHTSQVYYGYGINWNLGLKIRF